MVEVWDWNWCWKLNMWRSYALPHCNLSLLWVCLWVRHKIVALIGTGFRQERVTALAIASPRRGGIIKFVRSAITMKVVALVSATETGGKGADLLIGGLAMNLRGHRVVSHSRDPMVGISAWNGEICLSLDSLIQCLPCPVLSGAFYYLYFKPLFDFLEDSNQFAVQISLDANCLLSIRMSCSIAPASASNAI